MSSRFVQTVFHPRISILLSLLVCLCTAACRDSDHFGKPLLLSTLLITLDTTRIDSLSVYGAPPGTTPNIDRLALESLRYDAARAVAPITMPSHASMLTGLFPPRHTVRNNNIEPLPRSAHTLAELAREDGLETAAFVSSIALDPALGFDQGFDRYESPPRGEARKQISEKLASETISQAIDWLKRRDPSDPTRRFFLWLHLFDPHDPYTAPPEFASRFPRDPYLAEVAYMDSELGRLFDFLEADGHLDDTLLMLVGDHGEGLGQHGEKFHGIFLYDETIRVPLIVRDPSGWRAGESTDEIVSVADVFPTLGDAMGLPQQAGIDGRSLFRRSVPEDRGVYFETYQAWILYGYAPAAGWADARGKYLHAARPEFYDTISDPGEEDNLASQRADELARYRDAIAEVADAPALHRSDEQADASMLAALKALGYVAATTGDESFPDPLDVTGLPSSARWAEENAAFLQARELARAGRFDEAIAIYRIILFGNPNNWVVMLDYGFTLLRAGRHQDALLQLQRYQAGGAPEAAAFMSAGICLLRLDREAEAILQFERALKLDAHFTPALRQLVRVHRDAGRLEESKHWREKLRKIQPEQPGEGSRG